MIRSLLVFIRQEVPGPKLLVTLMSLLAALAQGLLLSTLNRAVDPPPGGEWQAGLLLQFLFFLALFLLASYFTMYKATEMVGYTAHHLRSRICRKLARAALPVIERYGHGEIYAHITRDIDRVTNIALSAPTTLHSVVLLVFCIAYIGWLSLWGLVVILLSIACGLFVYLFQEQKANTNLLAARAYEADFLDVVDDELGGFKEIKLSEEIRLGLLDHLEHVSDKFRFHYARTRLLFFFSFLSSHSFLYGAIAFAALLPPEWFVKDAASHFKLLTAFLFSINPIRDVVEFIEPCNHAAVSLNKLHQLESMLDRAEEPAVTGLTRFEEAVGSALEFQNVHMHYQDLERDVSFKIGPLDFSLRPGTITFVVGGNGSGKTSLLKLLTGLYAPESGLIILNGQALQSEGLPDYRQNFSALFSDFHLFRQLYATRENDPAAIEALLGRLDLEHKTGFDGARFTHPDLSTGQRKRLALIPLLLENRPFLVLDEFAADQDPEFREFFYLTLLPELRAQGKTVIAATHDDAYFDCCDQILKMDMGRIVSMVAVANRRAQG